MSTIGKFSRRAAQGRGPLERAPHAIGSTARASMCGTTAVMAAIAALALAAIPAPARAGTFSLTGEIDPARQYHSATLLPNGKVLVAGGYGSGGVGWLVDSQLFDPQKEDYINTGRLSKGDFILTGRLITRRDAPVVDE